MIAEGAMNDPKPEAIFGLHVVPGRPGSVFYRPEGFMAASDRVDIRLKGKQTHGAWPWRGVDVIAVASKKSRLEQQAFKTEVVFDSEILPLSARKEGQEVRRFYYRLISADSFD